MLEFSVQQNSSANGLFTGDLLDTIDASSTSGTSRRRLTSSLMVPFTKALPSPTLCAMRT